MISLDKAMELKEAGLAWEPKFGDVVIMLIRDVKFGDSVPARKERLLVVDGDNIGFNSHKGWHEHRNIIWLPSLSQLLAEIGARGWHYIFNGKNTISEQYGIVIANDDMFKTFEADTPEDACANALLWILKEEKK